MADKFSSINLVKGKNKSFFDKLIKWAFTVGRLIIILTEGLALTTFLYRFSLDRDLVDLHDKITQKQAIVKMLKNNEYKYRNLQERLAVARTLSNSSQNIPSFFKGILGKKPNGLEINNFIFSKDYAKFEASARSVKPISVFLNEIKKHTDVKTVSLDRIENRTSTSTITVNITVYLKK